MSGIRTAYPRLALPCTVIADGELVHLIAGEDVRYSLRAGACATSLAALLLRCDGSHSLDALLLEISEAENRRGSWRHGERGRHGATSLSRTATSAVRKPADARQSPSMDPRAPCRAGA